MQIEIVRTMQQQNSSNPYEQLTRYTFNVSSHRYIDRGTGRFVSVKEVRGAVDTVLQTETATVRGIAEKFVAGQINLPAFQLEMTSALKTIHVMMGAAAAGGTQQLSPSDLGYLGSQIKEQYKFLRTFAKQIKNGSQPIDGTLVARAALYAQAGRGVYEAMNGRKVKDTGAKQERSMIGVADHCGQCIEQAAMGWQSIGTLIPVGSRTCLTNCKCYFVYQR